MTTYHENKKRTNVPRREQAVLVIQGLLPETPIEAWQLLEAAMTKVVEYAARSDPRYGGLFVEPIERVTPPPGHCWAVWVNGKRLDRGVSGYVVQPGDRIEWRIEEIEAVAMA